MSRLKRSLGRKVCRLIVLVESFNFNCDGRGRNASRVTCLVVPNMENSENGGTIQGNANQEKCFRLGETGRCDTY